MNVGINGKQYKNIIFSLLYKFVLILCGFVVPRVLIKTYGAEAYGLTVSIQQFLAYIALLEGGIGGVVRAALYKPILNNDVDKIKKILYETNNLFNKIGYACIVYIIVLAVSFKYISNSEVYDLIGTAILVIVISISVLSQYFIGLTYQTFLQADQRLYITDKISILSIILNTILIVFLVYLGYGLIFVKFVSSVVFLIRPLYMLYYVRKNYNISPLIKSKGLIKDKWAGLSQHLAYFLHSNTDMVILTVMLGLKSVAVYSIYYMIIKQIQDIVVSFAAGMEGYFGELLAKMDIKKLINSFINYDSVISSVGIILFSTTLITIIPFIRIYTKGIHDVNFILPTLAIVMTACSLIYCLRTPFHGLIIAAGHFRETQLVAYAEAGINILLSILLVQFYGIIGVVFATLCAITMRWIFYIFYLSKYIIKLPMMLILNRIGINIINILCILCYTPFIKVAELNYLSWIKFSIIILIINMFITIIIQSLFSKNYRSLIRNKIKHIY